MVTDGNCQFRSLSFHIFGHQDEHLNVRKLITRFEEMNKGIFAERLTDINEATIDEHIQKMKRPFLWGTHVELMAAASLFQVHIYYCTKAQAGNHYKWERFATISSSVEVKYPEQSEIFFNKSQIPSHFELAYYSGWHYNCVVSADSGKTSKEPPQLIHEVTNIVLDD